MSNTKKGITVRFEDDEMAALEALAKKYKVSSATIIRWALTALNDYVQANNGRVVLPLDFSDFLEKSQRTELRSVAEEPGNEFSPSTPAPIVPTKYPTGRRNTKRKA